MQPLQARKTVVMCKRIDAKVNCTSKDKNTEQNPSLSSKSHMTVRGISPRPEPVGDQILEY